MTGTELALGTAQFGLKYGIAGRQEPVPDAEIQEILATAWACGVRMIDTAPVYGDIEERIASLIDDYPFAIVSKVPAIPPESRANAIATFVSESIHRSCNRIGKRLSAILFHRGEDLLGLYGEIAWQAAVEATTGTEIRLGVSCYSAAEADAIRIKYPIAIAQIPGNAFDQRLVTASCIGRIEVHLRSVFLQGLLLMSARDASARLPRAATAVAAWDDWCRGHGLVPLQAALSIVKGLGRVRYCVVGVDRHSHLEDIVVAWERAQALQGSSLAIHDPDVIDPRRWKPNPHAK